MIQSLSRSRASLISGLLLALCLPMGAHHSFAGFDMEKAATLAGTVKEFQWVNPHSWIQVMVADVEWSVEMSAPSSLLRRGWKPRTLKPGDRIVVVIHPLRDGKPGGSFVSAQLADGTPLGGSPTGDAAAPAPERKQ